MALDLTVTYPGQVDGSDPAYPHGKAQNVVVEGDGTGTPLEKSWLNDNLGFQQALLVEAEITPSGVADTALVSQYLEALLKIIRETEVFDEEVTFEGNVILDGGLVVNAASAFNAFAQFNAAANFIGATGFLSAATFFSGFTTTNAVLHGTVLSDAAITQSAEVVLSGAGRIRDRTIYGTNANSSYGVLTADVVSARSTVITGNRDYTLLSTGAVDGSRIEFHNWSAFTLTLKNEGSDTLATLDPAVGVPPTNRPSIARCRYEDDGLTARWMVLEVVTP